MEINCPQSQIPAPAMVAWIWEQLHDLFGTDDGSLPELWLAVATSDDHQRLVQELVNHGRLIPLQTTWWDTTSGQEHTVAPEEKGVTECQVRFATVWETLKSLR